MLTTAGPVFGYERDEIRQSRCRTDANRTNAHEQRDEQDAEPKQHRLMAAPSRDALPAPRHSEAGPSKTECHAVHAFRMPNPETPEGAFRRHGQMVPLRSWCFLIRVRNTKISRRCARLHTCNHGIISQTWRAALPGASGGAPGARKAEEDRASSRSGASSASEREADDLFQASVPEGNHRQPIHAQRHSGTLRHPRAQCGDQAGGRSACPAGLVAFASPDPARSDRAVLSRP